MGGRQVYFELFRAYYLDPEDTEGFHKPTYDDLAARHGISKNDVSNYLQHVKRRYREVLRQALFDTVESPEALRREILWFTGGTSDGRSG